MINEGDQTKTKLVPQGTVTPTNRAVFINLGEFDIEEEGWMDLHSDEEVEKRLREVFYFDDADVANFNADVAKYDGAYAIYYVSHWFVETVDWRTLAENQDPF